MLSSQLYIGTDVDASPASNDWIQVQTLASSSPLFFLRQIETRSMFWQDFKNGEKHQVYNCQTRYDQIISDLNVHIQNDSVSLGETEICEIHFGSEGDLPACRNSLASIQYTILHGQDNDNKIYAAYADVVRQGVGSGECVILSTHRF
mmetsp:Transcript_35022/g.108405  ORF Transcript_35022/g.108405 Transcript_35022/m.108405 type:complete len:148 (+) Transcript_35022:1393-1836(+)